MWIARLIAKLLLGSQMQRLEVALDRALESQDAMSKKLDRIKLKSKNIKAENDALKKRNHELRNLIHPLKKLRSSYERHDEIVSDLEGRIAVLRKENDKLTLELGKANRRFQLLMEERVSNGTD